MTAADLSDTRPATDLLIGHLREVLGERLAHEHPGEGQGPDLFCLNLTSYMGERMGPVLRRLADEQAETKSWKDRHTALADEFAAEVDRLTAERDAARAMADELRDDLRAADESNTNLQQHIAAIRAGEF